MKFIAISGTTSVTENFYVYEHAGELLVVDCGIGFSEYGQYGADLVLPDFSYVLKNRDKLRGILLTHGHEDHIGAVPYLVRELGQKINIYASALTIGFLKDKFAEHNLDDDILRQFDPDSAVVNLGPFKVTPFRVTHSVPDSVGYFINTSAGAVVHVSDFKFDWTPVDGRPFDTRKLTELASQGVVAMTSDCLGSTSPGYTQSEQSVKSRIEEVFSGTQGRIFFTTISSNISRMQQAIEVAAKHRRKVVFVGRSIEGKTSVARQLGQLVVPRNQAINIKQVESYRDSEICFIVSGSYGQSGSSLGKIVGNRHKTITLKQSDTVVFSADPAPPGSKEKVDSLVDKLLEGGVSVHYYDIQEDLHVSGHGSQEDIKMLLSLVRPRWAIPIGGTVRHMKAYEDLVSASGIIPKKRVIKLLPGTAVEFHEHKAIKRAAARPQSRLLSGTSGSLISKDVVNQRQSLAASGVLTVAVITGTSGSPREVLFAQSGLERPLDKKTIAALKKSLLTEFEKADKNADMRSKIAKSTAKHYKQTTQGPAPVILPVVVRS